MKQVPYIPFLIFIALVSYLGYSLLHKHPVTAWESINLTVPDFSVKDDKGVSFTRLDLQDDVGDVYLINFFASWCTPCHVEHKHLLALAQEKKIKIVGISYKDTPDGRKKYLAKLGNPYVRVLVDEKGLLAIPFGINGLPETYIIKNNRAIARYRGPLMADSFAELSDFIK